ncbi:MAG: ATP-binding protein [Clostridiales bacterium]|nr:ATP-binding protein [Clostridiales bacterium]
MNKIAEQSKYKPRIIDKTVAKYLSTFGAVCIEGPKWCGKTWTSSHHSNSEFLIGDPANNFQNRKLAEMSPSLVLEGETPRLLDEWQEVPPIWDAVRYTVDRRAEKGQFILTGSSTPKRKGVLHSGAGRIGKLRMRTMSLYESGESSGAVSLEDLCNGKLTPALTGEVDLRDLANYTVRGGWPGNLNVAQEDASLLPQSYLDAILDDDSQRIDDKKYDVAKMRLLLHSLARNESTTATKKKLLNDIREFDDETIDADTVTTYLDVFDRLFLLDNQPPFSANIRSSVRVKQAEKRHFCDPALACALLKATPDRLIGDLETFGFLFEALVERDLKIYAKSFGANLFHYQDYNNKEIDAVIELEDGRWCAFEIKLGANQIDKAATELVALRNSIEQEGGISPSVLCVICGLSNAAYVRPDGVFVVPITALKN